MNKHLTLYCGCKFKNKNMYRDNLDDFDRMVTLNELRVEAGA